MIDKDTQRKAAAFARRFHQRIIKAEPSLRGVNLKLDWSPRRTTSYGGAHDINLAMADCLKPTTCLVTRSIWADRYGVEAASATFHFHEYKALWFKPGIGSFGSDCWKPVVAALICHELAHSYHHRRRLYGHPDVRSHGAEWQKTYWQFRHNHVNLRFKITKARKALPTPTKELTQ
jgi:hypothetical protein